MASWRHPWARERGDEIRIRRGLPPLSTLPFVLYGLAATCLAIGAWFAYSAATDPLLGRVGLQVAASFAAIGALSFVLARLLRRRGPPAKVELAEGYVTIPGAYAASVPRAAITAVVIGASVETTLWRWLWRRLGWRRTARFTVAVREGATGSIEATDHVVTWSERGRSMLELALWLCDRLDLPLCDEVHTDNERPVPIERLRAATPLVRIEPIVGGRRVVASPRQFPPLRWAVETVRGHQIDRVRVVADEDEARRLVEVGRSAAAPALYR